MIITSALRYNANITSYKFVMILTSALRYNANITKLQNLLWF